MYVSLSDARISCYEFISNTSWNKLKKKNLSYYTKNICSVFSVYNIANVMTFNAKCFESKTICNSFLQNVVSRGEQTNAK